MSCRFFSKNAEKSGATGASGAKCNGQYQIVKQPALSPFARRTSYTPSADDSIY